ncbi:sensor histidine kinase [Emticicia sp. SJ17W-69]|uniref:sensor histidine kinase n=1 Tax=Emticicia sp. SJ17W-69 TaxID=3421657 RepID=UPI003EB8A84F
MNKLTQIFVIFLFTYPYFVFGGNVKKVQFDRNFKYLYLSGENQYVRSEKRLTFAELVKDANTNTLTFLHNFKTKRDNSFYCIKIEVQNIDNEDIEVIMLVDEPRIDHFNFVMFENGKPINTFSKFILDPHIKILGNKLINELPLVLKAKTSYKLYFQIDNRISLNKLKLPLKFIAKSYYPTQQFWATLFEKIYLGTLFFIVVFTLIFVVLYRQRIYFFYFLYLLGLVIFYVCVNNFIVYVSDSETFFKNNWSGLALSYFLMLVGYVHFSEEFLNVSQFVKPIYIRYLNLLKKSFYIYYIVSISLLWLFNFSSVKVAAVSVFIINPLMLLYIWYFIFKAFQNKFSPVYLFTLSYFPIFLVGFFLDPLGTSGLLGANINAIFYSSHIFELFTLSIAIIYRFRLIEVEKNNLNLVVFQQKENLLNVEIKAQEMERERLAKDLHDDLGGTLTAIRNMAISKPNEKQLLPLIDRAIIDLRNVSKNLLPINLVNNGLIKAVQQNINYLQVASNIEFDFITFGKEKRLNKEEELHTYRIIAELLNNIIKHSVATKATMQILYYDDYLHISIEDNGIGIDTHKNNLGIGLLNIQARIDFLKSKLIIDTNENGTLITFDVYYSTH